MVQSKTVILVPDIDPMIIAMAIVVAEASLVPPSERNNNNGNSNSRGGELKIPPPALDDIVEVYIQDTDSPPQGAKLLC